MKLRSANFNPLAYSQSKTTPRFGDGFFGLDIFINKKQLLIETNEKLLSKYDVLVDQMSVLDTPFEKKKYLLLEMAKTIEQLKNVNRGSLPAETLEHIERYHQLILDQYESVNKWKQTLDYNVKTYGKVDLGCGAWFAANAVAGFFEFLTLPATAPLTPALAASIAGQAASCSVMAGAQIIDTISYLLDPKTYKIIALELHKQLDLIP